MQIKKCNKCGAMIEVLQECTCQDCGIKCCGENMSTLPKNQTEFAFEKHMPEYEIVGNYIVVKVNHVMEQDHFIEWVALESEEVFGKKKLKPDQKAVAVFPYIPNSIIYGYCNKHGLWSKKVE